MQNKTMEKLFNFSYSNFHQRLNNVRCCYPFEFLLSFYIFLYIFFQFYTFAAKIIIMEIARFIIFHFITFWIMFGLFCCFAISTCLVISLWWLNNEFKIHNIKKQDLEFILFNKKNILEHSFYLKIVTFCSFSMHKLCWKWETNKFNRIFNFS